MRKVGQYIGRHHWGMLGTFIALGGTAYAATQLPANSVGTKQIQNDAVTLAKIGPRVRAALNVGGGGLRGAYIAEDDRFNGALHSVSVHVPAGSYIANGQCTATHYAPHPVQGVTFGYAAATLSASGPPDQTYPNSVSQSASVPDRGGLFPGIHGSGPDGPFGSAVLAATAGFRLSKAGEISLTCGDETQEASSGPGVYGLFSLTAIPVSSLHGLP